MNWLAEGMKREFDEAIKSGQTAEQFVNSLTKPRDFSDFMMQVAILYSEDTDMLDRLIENHNPDMPFRNEEGERVGTIIKVHREGNKLIGHIREWRDGI